MSDSLYKPEERSRIRPKVKGLLHFGGSTLTRDGKGIDITERKNEFANIPC